MRVPLSWLKDYVDVKIPAMELADKLTSVGVPVEAVEYISPEVTGVVAGYIKNIRPHPNADKLRLCDVDFAGTETIQIVTGAQNVQQGHTVPVALHGANLSEGLKIKRSKIRGEASEGMMCSAKELGIDIKDLPADQREGVLILPADTPAGASVIEIFCLNDPILVFETFANRPDQLSILGIAREVAAITGEKVKMPAVDFVEQSRNVSDMLSVKVEDYNLCKKYSGRIITEMENRVSPLWMQGRLMAAGIRTVSLVVDITNYVMIETGQPLHAFDYDKVKGSKIIVRPARDGEVLKSIDGVDRKLDPSMLVIADERDPVAIAGVMGGLDSEISESTTKILLESANFNQASIRRTSIKLGLRSESSRRFEKGIDFYRVDMASRRASHLLEKFGGKILKGEAVDSITPPKEVKIELRPGRVNRILGTDISKETIKNLLESLDFETEEKNGNYIVTIPSVRCDINEEIDLIEEVARLYSYDNIPTTHPQGMAAGWESDGAAFDEKLRDMLSKVGLFECITPGMLDRKTLDQFKIDEKNLLEVKNPLVEEQRVLRYDAVPHLIGVIKRNIAARRYTSKLFEISKLYRNGENNETVETRELAVVISLPKNSAENDFLITKRISEYICQELSIEEGYEKGELPYLHPNKTAKVTANDQIIGYIGVIHPQIAAEIDMDQPIVVLKLDIDKLRAMAKVKKYKQIPRFPAVERDIAVVMDDKVTAAEVKEIIIKNGKPLIDEAYCFDVYKGGQIPEDRKSLAFSLTFSAEDRTLTDKEVQEKIDSIIEKLKGELGATLRGA